MDTAVAGFQKQFPNIKMDWQHLGDWLTKFKATLASGQGVPDLVWLEATDVQNFGAQGALLDLTERLKPIKDQFSSGKVAEVFIVKKQQYVAMPGDIGLIGLWYRPDLLTAAGVTEFSPDLTFDQFVAAAAQLHTKTNVAAFLLPSAGFSFPFEILLSQLGGSITSLDGTTVSIDDAKGVQAMTLLKQLWDTKANLDTAWLQPDYWAAVKGGKIAADFMALGGTQPLFVVSGWIVSAVEDPLPAGYARASTLAAAGFVVMATPQFIGEGHVTILLSDPVDAVQAGRFNAAFGVAP